MAGARASRFFVPLGVYMTTDGGEWLLRKMANGVHVIGPYATDSLGYWPSEANARSALVKMAGDGTWERQDLTG